MHQVISPRKSSKADSKQNLRIQGFEPLDAVAGFPFELSCLGGLITFIIAVRFVLNVGLGGVVGKTSSRIDVATLIKTTLLLTILPVASRGSESGQHSEKNIMSSNFFSSCSDSKSFSVQGAIMILSFSDVAG
jgi:hypothetical protein